MNAETLEALMRAKYALGDMVFAAWCAHPGPWRIRKVWQHEVIAADGAVIARCQQIGAAAEILRLSRALQADTVIVLPE